MSQKGFLIVLSGFSGSGKGTIVKRLLEKYPDKYAVSISATTRTPRKGERDGIEYFFKTEDEFLKMISQDQLLEHAKYVNHYYGTPKSYVFDQLDQSKNVILEIEIQGALKIKRQFPDTLLLFVTPPSIEELKKRLIHRSTEPEDVINRRIARAYEEAQDCEFYDYLIVNDKLEECVDRIHQLVENESYRMSHNIDMIHTFKKDLQAYSKGEPS